jgi:hypothetical protein
MATAARVLLRCGAAVGRILLMLLLIARRGFATALAVVIALLRHDRISELATAQARRGAIELFAIVAMSVD